MPLDRLQQLGLAVQQTVAGDHHVAPAEVSQHFFPVSRAKNAWIERWGKPAYFRFPIEANRKWRDDERRALRAAMQQERNCLQGLAKPHVVGQTSPGTPVRQATQPAKALDLIVPQLGVERRGNLESYIASVRQPFLPRLPVLVGFERAPLVEVAERRCADQWKAQRAVFAIRK